MDHFCTTKTVAEKEKRMMPVHFRYRQKYLSEIIPQNAYPHPVIRISAQVLYSVLVLRKKFHAENTAPFLPHQEKKRDYDRGYQITAPQILQVEMIFPC